MTASRMPRGRVPRLVAVGYVLTVVVLTAVAFSSDDTDHWGAEIAAAVLTLPTIIPALPVIYVVGAAAWSIGPMWPVTLAFASMMAVVACGNVALATAASRRLRGRRGASARTRSGA